MHEAYAEFDRKHEQYTDDREESERWEFETEHRESCDMDLLIFVPDEKGLSPMACCTECFSKVWVHEKALVAAQSIAA